MDQKHAVQIPLAKRKVTDDLPPGKIKRSSSQVKSRYWALTIPTQRCDLSKYCDYLVSLPRSTAVRGQIEIASGDTKYEHHQVCIPPTTMYPFMVRRQGRRGLVVVGPLLDVSPPTH